LPGNHPTPRRELEGDNHRIGVPEQQNYLRGPALKMRLRARTPWTRFCSGKALRDLLDELAMSATSRTSS
jgi:hypothetical protein